MHVNSSVSSQIDGEVIEQPFSATNAIKHTKDLLLTTSKTTQSVLAHVGNRKWWKHVLTNIGSDTHGQRVAPTKDENVQQYYSFYDKHCQVTKCYERTL